MTEWNLSDKIASIGKYNTIECLSKEDVKEFIRRLNEDKIAFVGKCVRCNKHECVDKNSLCLRCKCIKIAGSKLIGENAK